MTQLSFIDLSIIICYLCLIFFIAHFSHPKATSDRLVQDVFFQYLANRNLTFFESLSSLIATEVSALTFLGIPSFAFKFNFSFLLIYIGAIGGRFIIARYFLPHFYNDELTIYSTLRKKGLTKNSQSFIVILYGLSKILAVGVRLYTGSIILSEFFQLSTPISLMIICLLTFLYTLKGGLKAVVRTDILQMLVFLIGGISAHFMIPYIQGETWWKLISIAHVHHKLDLYDSTLSLFIGVIGGMIFDMASHGTDQGYMQRLTANRSLKSAQKAIFYSSFLSIFIGILFLSIGSLLWAFYKGQTPPGISADQLFAYFINHHFPPGLKGLMLAGVLAATMSTLDSTINALSSTLYSDIFRFAKNLPHHLIKKYHFRDSVLITTLLYFTAVLSSQTKGVLIVGLKITSWVAGPLLAIVIFLITSRKDQKYTLDSKQTIIIYIVGIFMVAINQFFLKWSWELNMPLSLAMSTLILHLLKNKIKNKSALKL